MAGACLILDIIAVTCIRFVSFYHDHANRLFATRWLSCFVLLRISILGFSFGGESLCLITTRSLDANFFDPTLLLFFVWPSLVVKTWH